MSRAQCALTAAADWARRTSSVVAGLCGQGSPSLTERPGGYRALPCRVCGVTHTHMHASGLHSMGEAADMMRRCLNEMSHCPVHCGVQGNLVPCGQGAWPGVKLAGQLREQAAQARSGTAPTPGQP